MIAAPSKDNSDTRRDQSQPQPPAHEPYEHLLRAVGQWWAAVREYSQVRGDLFSLKLKKTLFGVALKAVAGILGLVLLASALTMTLYGIAGGLTEALGGRAWAANLITGGTLLLAAGAGYVIWSRGTANRARREVVERCRNRHNLHQKRIYEP